MEQETKKEGVSEEKISVRDKIIDGFLYAHDSWGTADFIRTCIEKKEFGEFTETELDWLSFRIDLVQKIKESEYACAIFYWLLKGQEIKRNFSTYHIAKRVGVYIRTVQHWMGVFKKDGLLIEVERRRMGAKVLKDHFFNPKLMGVVDLIYDIIQREMGNKLLKIANKNNNLQWHAIEKWREKNPEKTQKHKHNKQKRY